MRVTRDHYGIQTNRLIYYSNAENESVFGLAQPALRPTHLLGEALRLEFGRYRTHRLGQ